MDLDYDPNNEAKKITVAMLRSAYFMMGSVRGQPKFKAEYDRAYKKWGLDDDPEVFVPMLLVLGPPNPDSHEWMFQYGQYLYNTMMGPAGVTKIDHEGAEAMAALLHRFRDWAADQTEDAA